MHALILSPCCAYENEHNKGWFDMSRELELSDSYAAWTMYLYRSIVDNNHGSLYEIACYIQNDPHVMSPKSHYIVTNKRFNEEQRV